MTLFQYIKSNVAIGDLIGEYVTLRSAGTYLKGHCPFHSEKTASFTVSPNKGIFYCFGCHESGDVISFLAKLENYSQIEAANELVERYALELPEELKSSKNLPENVSEKKELQHICAFFSKWCTEQFNGSLAKKYITERGIKTEKFVGLLGYFPSKKRNKFLQEALDAGFLADDLKKVGIITQGQTGVYSPFEERLIFTIKDHLGNPVAFGGRIFNEQDTRAKYYNSKEHGVFKKGELLYGLDQAKKDIQKLGSVILVEGYLDCLMMWQAGYTNTVATLGTACTIDQLSLISRYANTVYVMYDSDKAGVNAMLKLVGLCWKVSLDLKVVSLPSGVDPADYVLTKGNVSELIENAFDIYKYYISNMGESYNKRSFAEKVDQIQELISVIEKVPDQLKRDLLLHEAAKEFDLPVSIFKKQTKHVAVRVEKPVAKKIEDQAFSYDELPGLQKRFVAALLHDSSLYDPLFELWSVALQYPLNDIVAFVSRLKKDDRHWQDAIWELDKGLIEFVHRLALEYDHSDNILNFDLIRQQFKKNYWKDIVKAFQEKIIFAEQAGDPDKVQNILKKFQELKTAF